MDEEGQRLTREEVLAGKRHKLAKCSCQRARRVVDRIPQEFRAARLMDFEPAVLTALTEFVKSGASGLYIHGLTGRRKSWLAAALVHELLLLNCDAHFFEMAQIYRDIRSCFNGEVSEEEYLRGITAAEWVVLDDVGAGAGTDFERRYLVEILNGRVGDGRKRTIVTSNLSLEEIRDRIDERVSSRLKFFADVEMKGRDRRAD